MTALARPRGDEAVADIADHATFGERLAAEAVAAATLDELLADIADRPDHARIVVLCEVFGRLTVAAPAAVTEAVTRTMESMP